jgi:chromosome segregation ATPase
MTPFSFRQNDLLGPSCRKSITTTPEMNELASEIIHSRNIADRDDGIEEIAERLVNLADRINRFNTTKRSAGLTTRSVGYVGRALTKKQSLINYISGDEFVVHKSPVNATQGDNAPNEVDVEGRIWPQLPIIQRPNSVALENKVADQSKELTKRCIQIADLSNIRQQQADELLAACDEIECLRKSIAELQQALAQRDSEVAATKEEVISLVEENHRLQDQLNKAQRESDEFSKRLLEVEIELNKKNVDSAATQETIERQNMELAGLQAQRLRIETAFEERLKQHHRDEIDRLNGYFDIQILELKKIVAERDRKILDLEAAQTELVARFKNLSKTAAAFEGAHENAKNALSRQADNINVLETLLRVERETSNAKMRALIQHFQQGELEQSAKEPVSAEIQKHIALLLPRLAMRHKESYASVQNEPTPCENAA